MKMKKLLALILSVVLCFVVSACDLSKNNTRVEKNETTQKQTETREELKSGDATPLLYKVSDEGGNVVWLFGSIHVGEKYYYPLPDYVFDALNGADSLAVEFDIIAYSEDQTATVEMLYAFANPNGEKIKNLIDEDLYKKAKKILKENGMYSTFLDMYMPILWSQFIDQILYEEIGVKTNLGVDRHLLEYAYENNIEILDVESAEFQYNMMANYSMELQELLLKESIANLEEYIDEYEEYLDEMMYIWAKGDEKAMEKLLSEDDIEFESKDEEKLYEEYNNAMIVQRNKNMTDWAENALKSGKEVFICVGAAHVVGPGAMAEMLAQRGYKVEIVR